MPSGTGGSVSLSSEVYVTKITPKTSNDIDGIR